MSGPRVVIVGAEPTYFGHDEWARHLFPMKTLDQGLALRGRIRLRRPSVRRPRAVADHRLPFRYRNAIMRTRGGQHPTPSRREG